MLWKLHSSQLEEARQCKKAVGAHPKTFSLEKYVEHYLEITCSKAKLLLDRIKISRFIAMKIVLFCGDKFLCFEGIIYL